MSTQFKVCNCNRSMPLDAGSGEQFDRALGASTGGIATQLCRREIGSYLGALDGSEQVVVGCTQERVLFSELAQEKQAAGQTTAPIRFVNLRETGGWSRQAPQALPKMAALLAAAALPDPEPVPEINYVSRGHVLLIGPAVRALPWAKRLAGELEVSVLLSDVADAASALPMSRQFPVFSGTAIDVRGWLGAFRVNWKQANPIELELCTRCNACIAACPEGAIDLRYQIDLDKCRSHHDCVKACGAIGAIDFAREDTARDGAYDLIFDLSQQPLIALHQPPQGYFAPGADATKQAEDALRLRELVGEFSKPKFFSYKERICAHSRNQIRGCNACIDVCSAAAITHDGDHIKVDPHLCVGCGACTTVCPSGALSYAYPRAPDLGKRLQTMLSTYARAGGRQPALLLHSQQAGSELILQLGRLAQAGRELQGLPARMMPVDLHHTASTGIDVWLAAIAWGASNIVILMTDEEAPQYRQALAQQIDTAQTILSALGYRGRHLYLAEATSAEQLDAALQEVDAAPAQAPAQAALFHIAADKRTTLELALAHLAKHAPGGTTPDEIALPAGAPYGTVHVDTAACTLCMSCVGACPESALTDNPALPQLRLTERNCVQCGLCEATCPEDAISLQPRLLMTERAKQAVVLNEAEPCHCIRCGKPFGTLQIVESMLARLAQHGAFAGNLDRIRMCSDCRVIDMMENKQEARIAAVAELRRPSA